MILLSLVSGSRGCTASQSRALITHAKASEVRQVPQRRIVTFRRSRKAVPTPPLPYSRALHACAQRKAHRVLCIGKALFRSETEPL